MTDIVERLRKLSKDMLTEDLDMRLTDGSVDPSEAADEIERLRAELAGLKGQEPIGYVENRELMHYQRNGGTITKPPLYSRPNLYIKPIEGFDFTALYAAPVPAVETTAFYDTCVTGDGKDARITIAFENADKMNAALDFIWSTWENSPEPVASHASNTNPVEQGTGEGE